MKKWILILWGICSLLFAENVEETIQKSEKAAAAGNLAEAVQILKIAIEENSQSADLYAKYGLFISRQAGEASMMKAGMLSEKAFKQFSQALELEPEHLNAILYRGILSVSVPEFMGKLEQGITDLELIQSKYGADPLLYTTSTYYLGIGYQKNEEFKKAVNAFNYIVLYAQDTQFYEDAKSRLKSLKDEKIENSNEDHYKLGMQYLEENNLQKSVEHLRIAAKLQPENLELYLIFARALGELASLGYDNTINEDVTIRAGMAHEIHEVLSHCVELSPGDEEILFLRGSVAVDLPFFVNSLDTGIEDLEFLSKNAEAAEIRSQSAFLLQQAIITKKVFELAETGYLAEGDEEKQQLLSQFIPTESQLKQKEPIGDYLKIGVTIGYRDQIAPQTAVWVEDINGNYLATIYISGFAAFVKQNQLHLPRWAESSKFQEIELVTGASIDCGKHTFYWDFIDFENNKFSDDKIVIKTEICHWPHVQYSQQSLSVDLTQKTEFRSTGDGYLLPEISAVFIKKK